MTYGAKNFVVPLVTCLITELKLHTPHGLVQFLYGKTRCLNSLKDMR